MSKMQTDIATGLQGKHLQAVSTKNERGLSASSSSGDGEDHMLAYKAQWAKEAELRELREENKRLKSEGKNQ